MSRRRRSDNEEKIRNHLGGFGFSQERADTHIGDLSGGEKARLLFALMSADAPNVLLLDEPTSSMDQATEKKVVAALKETCMGKTMLIVTHRNPILTIVDRVFVLENGTIVADQTPQQLGIKK